ncbi:MAG: hypothetical protein GY826_08605, partial [Fuerstiella sp.]|nr:hypothetical protein [Fuerstiella sp.]
WPEQQFAVGKRSFDPRWTLVVPAIQPEYQFIKSLLMRRKSFKENVFYDVSSWTLPLAYDLEQTGSPETIDVSEMRPAKILERMELTFTPDPAAGFYLVDWRDDDAVWLLNQLLKKGVNVKVAKQEFSVDESPSTRTYPAGTLLIPLGIQPDKRELIEEVLVRGAERG